MKIKVKVKYPCIIPKAEEVEIDVPDGDGTIEYIQSYLKENNIDILSPFCESDAMRDALPHELGNDDAGIEFIKVVMPFPKVNYCRGKGFKCHDKFLDNEETNVFIHKLIAYLGEDPSLVSSDWSWVDFNQFGDEFIEKLKRYFEEAIEGDPSWAAYKMCLYCNVPKKWAQRVIESATTGDPISAAFEMNKVLESPIEWVQKVINHVRTIRAIRDDSKGENNS